MSTAGPVDVDALPTPILPLRPDLVQLSRLAWTLSAQHITNREGIPASPYMDEGFDPETLWIWDSCFMALYCAMAADVFPGVNSLDNFYGPLHLGAPSALTIHHADNPPLFAWAEWEHLRHTGDLARVRHLLDSGVLQRHFAWFDSVPEGSLPPGTGRPTAIRRTEHGYRWSGVCSGMDNTPRAPDGDAHGTFGNTLWLDAMAQQALSARCLERLCRSVGREREAGHWRGVHANLVEWLNEVHWSDRAQCYLDRLDEDGFPFSDVITPASFWPLLAGAANAAQVDQVAARLRDPSSLGGDVPWTSVERSHDSFSPTGHYWRGGVWVPMAFVGARALAENGLGDLAHTTTLRLLEHMAACWREFEPATIWEAYSPTCAAPATAKDDKELVRPDFCGWSALAPTAMMVEHVLGFSVDALAGRVTWTRRLDEEHGVAHLRCGAAVLTCTTEARRGSIHGSVSGPLELLVDGVRHDLRAGEFTLAPPSIPLHKQLT